MERRPHQPEKAPEKPLFKVTFMRHEEPHYKDIGHDLTDRGVENARATGRRLREEGTISEEDELYLVHSPKPRARGTLEFVAEGAGIDHLPKRGIKQLRMSDIPDRAKFLERVEELGHDHEAIARDHHENELYRNRPDFIEPNDKKRARLYRALEYFIRHLGKQEPGEKTPHLLGTSHFELATLLVDDVFGIRNMERYNSPSFGEHVSLEAFPTDTPDRLRLEVRYRDHHRTVYFDRATRSVQIEDEG